MSQDYKKLAEKQIALGKPLAIVKNSLELYFKQEDKKAFVLQLQTEYDALYKTKEVVETRVLEDGTEDSEVVGFTYEDDCISFNDYINESIVITEAVEATYDENELLLTERIEAITKQVRPYIQLSDDELNDKVNEYLLSIDYVSEEVKNAKEYLNNTDWYIVRQAETGVETPVDILEKRQLAREAI